MKVARASGIGCASPSRRPHPQAWLATGVALCAGFAACATPSGAGNGYLDSWRGARELEVIRAWGEPTRASRQGDRRVLVYETRTEVHVPATGAAFGATGAGGGSSPMTVVMACVTTFEFVESVVQHVSASGNGCGHRRGLPIPR